MFHNMHSGTYASSPVEVYKKHSIDTHAMSTLVTSISSCLSDDGKEDVNCPLPVPKPIPAPTRKEEKRCINVEPAGLAD